jgi:dTDP-4-dehydrorhamnose 3,5-epimerase
MNIAKMEGVVIKKLEKFSDRRGWLAELFRLDEMDYTPVMSYVSVTKPGIVRGPHEHKYQSDCFVFLGPGSFELHLWDNRKNSQEYLKLEVGENNPTLVIVPPGVVHGYKCVSQIDGWCINLPDKLYRGVDKKEEVDEIRWEEKGDSPYKL